MRTFITTPTLAAKAGAESIVNIRAEVCNDSEADRTFTLVTDIFDPAGVKVVSVSSMMIVRGRQTVTVDQTTSPVAKPELWHPDHPHLYRAVTTVAVLHDLLGSGEPVDSYETPFGFRWIEWTADRGFFLNGQHLYLRGANVHQDQAGWGDAVTNAAFERDVRLVKEAGFNFIRGSHYPKDPAFASACDRLGVLWLSENVFWGIGGRHSDGGWGASAYPVTPEHETAFDDSVLASLAAMIRVHRNSPSIMAWSMSNEPFFSDVPMAKVRALLAKEVALAHELDPTRLAGVGGAQRPLSAERIDHVGDFAAYNGDGATQPAFQAPGVPSLVSEYGSVIAERPGAFAPGWSDLKSQLADGRPAQFPWRAGEAIWCMFDHGSHAGQNLARMGIVDYFRVPKRAYYWYRENYAGVPAPAWPAEGKPAKIALSADKTTISAPDGTDDAQLSISLLDAAGEPVSAAVPVTLSIVSGPGEFPTGREITFSPPGQSDASDISIRDGQAAIAFRSYYAGETMVRATSPGLTDATLTLHIAGSPVFVPGVTAPAAPRPYVRHVSKPLADAGATSGPSSAGDVLALNRPTQASSSAMGASSAFANDGDLSTAWRAAAATDQSFEVFLEVAYDVERVALVFPREAKHRYRIDVSADGVNWREVVDQSDTENTARRRLHVGDFGRGIVRIRVRFVVPPGGPLPELAEIQVGGAGRAKLPAGRLVGTVIGTPGSSGDNPGATREAVFDGELATYFDAPNPSGSWTGIDLGPGGAVLPSRIVFAPRSEKGNTTFPARMVGGRFQGANRADFSDASDLFVVKDAPLPGVLTAATLSPGRLFRYLRYLSPESGSCNIAEIAFIGAR